MSKQCSLTIRDYVNVKFDGLDAVTRSKLVKSLKFLDPKAKHTPQFKLKRWDGCIAFATMGGATYFNMLELALPIIYDAGYEVDIIDKRLQLDFEIPEIDEFFLSDRVWPEGHQRAGEPIMLRNYQVDAINRFFTNFQSIQSISTGAGKTILSAALSLAVEQSSGGRTIVIVPSLDLVKQTEEVYRSVGLDVGIYSGKTKDISKQHTICTWQSLVSFSKKSKKPETEFTLDEFIRDVKCVIADEVHGVAGPLLKELLCSGMRNIPIRWGFSGTIPREDYQFMSLLSALGPCVGEIKARDLMDIEVLATCDISIMELVDDHVKFADFEDENKFLATDKDRLHWLADFGIELEESGNTLILVNNIETGKIIQAAIPNSVFVSGQMKSNDRGEEYALFRTENSKTIIATFGVASTGIDIPRLFNLIIYNGGKSFRKIIQSCGRVIRRADDKEHAHIYDVTSTLKFAKRHTAARKIYYKEAGYPYSVTKIHYRGS